MISYELAKKLKDAGFPQPEPAFGQVWYFEHPETKWNRAVLVGTADFSLVENKMKHCAFAPTFEDIAALLPQDCAFGRLDGKPCAVSDMDGEAQIITGDTFAEAAANLWLTINAKPS